MKSFLLLFVTFFSIFAGIGFVRGLLLRLDPDVVHKLILAHIIPERRPGHLFIDADGNFQHSPNSKAVDLDYFCGEQTLLIWDVDSKKLTAGDRFYLDEFSEMVRDEHRLLPFPVSPSLVLSFLGGSSGAWGIRDLMKYSEEAESSHFQNLVAAILGGLSGYPIGYRAAMLGFPRCDSPKLFNLLRDPSKWEGGLEKDELKLTLAAAAAQAQKIPDPALRHQNIQQLIAELQRIQSPNAKISSASFILAAEAGGPGFEEAMRKKAVRQRLINTLENIFTYICFAFLGAAVVCVLWLKFGRRERPADAEANKQGGESLKKENAPKDSELQPPPSP
jgi:hypothetical protein